MKSRTKCKGFIFKSHIDLSLDYKLRFPEDYRIGKQMHLYFRDGRLRAGDELLMVNGKLLVGLTHQEAVATLRASSGLIQLVVASMVRTFSSQLERSAL